MHCLASIRNARAFLRETRLKVRPARAAVLAAACAFGPVSAQADERAALATMADLCATGFTSLQSARTALGAVGWQEDEGMETARNALAASVFAFRFDPADVGYSVLNADFMAASILGNSALGPNQLGFRLGGVQLGVLGVEEGTPYCVATGPAWILDAATGNVGAIAETSQPGPVRLRQGDLAEGSYSDALIDLAVVSALDPTAGAASRVDLPPVTREVFDRFLATIGAATIHISSKAAFQER